MIVMKTSPRKKGRPVKFDRAQALHQAMLCFWQSGYEGTSMAVLTQAMGMNAPSIYAAFGDKKSVFLKAVGLYLTGQENDNPSFELPEAPQARSVVETLLSGVIKRYTGENTPPGCLVGTSALSVSEGSSDIKQAVSQIRHTMEAKLEQRIQQDIEQGLLPPDTSAAGLATFISATIQGISTLARDGASREKLTHVKNLAMKAWPTPLEQENK
jgi:AcrR family transcriptional regulator